MAEYYEAFPDLRDIYLEDSFVLGIHEGDDVLWFDLEVVLTENHPQYRPPPEDVRYCYRPARLSFSGGLGFEWIERNFAARNVDPDGSVDLGNIDGFIVDDDGCYIDGEWGAIRIKCQQVQLSLR